MECRNSRGFTLVELLIVLSISAILLLIAVPNFLSLFRAAHLHTQSHNFVTAAQFARSESLKRNQRVFFCVRLANKCSDSPEWETGWLVFVDDNSNAELDAGELIRLFDGLATGYRLIPNISAKWLIYYPDGSVRRGGGSGGLPLMTFRLCAPDAQNGSLAERSREIVVNATGRMRLQVGREIAGAC